MHEVEARLFWKPSGYEEEEEEACPGDRNANRYILAATDASHVFAYS